MMKPENQQHAQSARKSLTAVYNNTDERAITSLLADLRHLCDATGLDFYKLDRRAYRRYEAEGGAQ